MFFLVSPRWENYKIHKFAVETPNPASLICQTRSLPEPQFHWERQGVNLTSGGNIQITSSGNISTLRIAQTSEADLMSYFCVGQNIAGKGTFELMLMKPGV